MTSEQRTSALEFPCRFPIKAMGRQSAEFERVVSEIIFAHARLTNGESLSIRPSTAGNYVSITAVIEAESQSQLDTIYQSLTDCELVLVAL
jgi:putative lipoic acid-binding regulatory protein